jgi:5'-nucleotidase
MKTIYLDMDGVLADFFGGLGRIISPEEDPEEIYRKGFYLNLPVMKGAQEFVRKLEDKGFNVYIASKPLRSQYCASEKFIWIAKHFPTLYRKIILTCDKTLLKGDILIDDQPHKWKGFEGSVIAANPLGPDFETIYENILNIT